MRQAQINSLQLQNNIHCESVELKLIPLKTTLSEGFCNSLITFNFEKIIFFPREIYYPNSAPKYLVYFIVVFNSENVT